MAFELRNELLKLALSGSERFSPYGAEVLKNDLGAGVSQADLSPASAAASLPGAPPPRTGFVTERLTPELGGRRQAFSTQAPKTTEELEAQITSRKLDLGKMRDIIRHAKGADTPEGYNRALNVFGFESRGFDPGAVGDRGRSIGIGQVNIDAHPEWKGHEGDLRDPYTSLSAGVKAWNAQGPERAYMTTWDRFRFPRAK